MKYIAINTAAQMEILLSTGDKDYYFSSPDKTLASTGLLPHINIMLTEAGLTLSDLDTFACVIGPGSFTGIRIGVSTVRAFAYALKKPVLPIIYFDVLAYNNTPPFTAAIDGGAGVAYLKTYDKTMSDPICVKNEDIISNAKGEIIASSQFAPAITKLAEKGQTAFKSAVEKAIKAGEFIPYDRLVPMYLRRSQPEREAGEI